MGRFRNKKITIWFTKNIFLSPKFYIDIDIDTDDIDIYREIYRYFFTTDKLFCLSYP